jgi:hypothetical protein
MPILDTFTRSHPEVAVLAVNIDDPVAARKLFKERGYQMQLVVGTEDATRRYGVTTIPHTVVIDGAGQVRRVGHAGGDLDLDATIAQLAH